jgi:hypothetical protein
MQQIGVAPSQSIPPHWTPGLGAGRHADALGG